MAQHDYIIANQSGAAFRADLNNGLAAIVSQNSGATQPSTTYAYQWWADTTTGLLKLRNAANSAWITIGTLADANLGLLAQSGGTLTGALLADDSGTAALPAIAFDGDPNTGIFSPGADQLGIATNGVERVEFGTSEVVFNDGGADVDFRIEGDTNPNLFKIDAGLDEVQVANLNGGPLAGTRNRIINGDMRIDQRNAGASVSTGTGTAGGYSVDRWAYFVSGGGAFSLQRSTDVPAGFTNSLLATVTTVDSSIAAGDQYQIRQAIEGFNGADLAWGTASASTITLSFWVRSSLTGTFSVSIRNGDGTLSYVATYTISTADTWEKKTVTISGPTSGTFAADNTTHSFVTWCMGAGSTSDATAGSWQSGNFLATSGSVDWIATNGATFYITGVQLEPGTVATPFERRSFGQELALCERYLEVCVSGAETQNSAGTGYGGATNFRAIKRVSPTVTRISDVALFNTGITPVVEAQSVNGFITACTVGAVTGGSRYLTTFQASAEL